MSRPNPSPYIQVSIGAANTFRTVLGAGVIIFYVGHAFQELSRFSSLPEFGSPKVLFALRSPVLCTDHHGLGTNLSIASVLENRSFAVIHHPILRLIRAGISERVGYGRSSLLSSWLLYSASLVGACI